MFIVRWEGGSPRDNAAWIAALREALAGETGSYRICFVRAPGGWRFVVDHRPGPKPEPEGTISNSPEAVAFNIRLLLRDRGLPLDPDWTP